MCVARSTFKPVLILEVNKQVSNRKLIRTTLAEVKGKAREVPQPRERSNGGSQRGPGSDGGRDSGRDAGRAAQQAAIQVRKRTPPPMETNAELFYYKKQIDAHTPMIIVLLDGEDAMWVDVRARFRGRSLFFAKVHQIEA